VIIPFTEMAWGRTVMSIGVVSAFCGVTEKKNASFFFRGFFRRSKKMVIFIGFECDP